MLFPLFYVFYVGFKVCANTCTTEMAPGSFRALLPAVPTFPVNYPSALLLLLLGSSSSPKVWWCKAAFNAPISFSFLFLVIKSILLQCQTFPRRKTPLWTQWNREAQEPSSMWAFPLLWYVPKCCFARKWECICTDPVPRKVKGHRL